MLVLLTGCSLFDDLKETVDGLTNPLVLEAVYLGVEQPDSAEIDLAGTDFDKDAVATVLLADAASVDDLANAPVEGASVTLKGGSGTVPLDDSGDGTYVAGGGLTYADGDTIIVSVELDGVHKAVLVAPPAVDADVPATHTRGEPLGITAGNADLAGLVVVVFEASSGNVTFDNRPDSIEEVYEWTHGGASLAVDVPGSAFPQESVYAVGVAGLDLTTDEDLTEVNTALSAFAAGKFRFYAVSTLEM